jgi:hypothetical protein
MKNRDAGFTLQSGLILSAFTAINGLVASAISLRPVTVNSTYLPSQLNLIVVVPILCR